MTDKGGFKPQVPKDLKGQSNLWSSDMEEDSDFEKPLWLISQ